MGRKKIPIERITDSHNRKVTLNKRKAGLMKKVYELSVLCNCEVALIIFDAEGKLHEFSNRDVDDITKHYQLLTDLTDNSQSSEVDIVKKLIEKRTQEKQKEVRNISMVGPLPAAPKEDQPHHSGLTLPPKRQEAILLPYPSAMPLQKSQSQTDADLSDVTLVEPVLNSSVAYYAGVSTPSPSMANPHNFISSIFLGGASWPSQSPGIIHGAVAGDLHLSSRQMMSAQSAVVMANSISSHPGSSSLQSQPVRAVPQEARKRSSDDFSGPPPKRSMSCQS